MPPPGGILFWRALMGTTGAAGEPVRRTGRRAMAMVSHAHQSWHGDSPLRCHFACRAAHAYRALRPFFMTSAYSPVLSSN
jgi:hypothetical protein